MALGLHSKPQTKTQNAHRISQNIISRHKPWILFHQFQVFIRQMKFNVVALTMNSAENTDVLKPNQCIIQGIIERYAWYFVDELGKTSTMNCEDSGFNMSIQDMPTYAEYGLIGNQANRVLVTVFIRMGQFKFEHAGYYTPGVRIDFIGGGRQNTTWMSDLMTGFTHCDTFKHIVIMVSDDVLEDGFWFAIELPQVQDDMIEVNQMMALKFLNTTTFQTRNPLISISPICVGKGGSDSFVEELPSRCVVHVSLYAQNGTWTGKMWYLDRKTHFGVNWYKELCQKNMYGIGETFTAGKTDCNSIIGAYILLALGLILPLTGAIIY